MLTIDFFYSFMRINCFVSQTRKYWLLMLRLEQFPRPFYQLLVVQAVFLDRCFPFACALMINKTEQSYKSVFEKILTFTGISPKYIVTDFEKALSNGAKNVFSADCFFCYFHFGQSIWRKLQAYSLSQKYTRMKDFKKSTKDPIIGSSTDRQGF